MRYASIVAMMNYLSDAIKPELDITVNCIINEVCKARIEFLEQQETWRVRYNINEELFTKDPLDIVGLLFKENYSLTELHNELEDLIITEAIYNIQRYKQARELVGREKVEASLICLKNIHAIKEKPITRANLTLIKQDEY